MTAASFLRDLLAFSVQIALVGLGIAMLLKLVKLPAGIRYTGLRFALVASLVAPWLLRTPEVQAPAPSTPAAFQTTFPTAGDAAAASAGATAGAATESGPAVPWVQLGFGALLIGIVARVVWLGIGVLRLFRLEREGVVVDAPEYSELQQQLGTRATIAQVATLPQPATFGVRRPVVLLPDTLAVASSSLRRAVVAHELFHVRRRDWLSVLAEEAVRTALWFHPAILWMTSQIQLAREEIVDELTVQATGDRRTYVEALMAFADTPGLGPAPAFARRRQLFHRILNVSKEKAMSRPRILSSAAVLLATVAGASWYASTLFPIVTAAKADAQASSPSLSANRASAQNGSRIVRSGNVVLRAGESTLRASNVELLLDQSGGQVASVVPVTPENPIPRRTRGVTPARPAQFSSASVIVRSRVTLDRNGAVTAVVPDGCGVVDGRGTDSAVCAAFSDAVSTAIRQWRYDRPVQGPIQFFVTITFRPGGEPTVTQSGEGNSAVLRQTQDGSRLAETDRGNADYQRAVASFQADLARMSDMFRELERAQRLGERGLLAQSSLQDAMARSRAELARVEAQLQNMRLTGDDRARAEAQYRAALEQYQAAEQQFRAVDAPQLQADRRVLEENYRANKERLLQAEEQLRAIQRQLDQANPSTDEQMRALKSPSGRTPIRVSDVPGMKAPTIRKNVKPEHPLAAVKARVEGTVVLEALVDEQGRVADVRVTKSIPLLDQAAMDAARQWEFTPTLMNGEPVPVLVQLEMDFRMR